MIERILLVGSGMMAVEYAKILKMMNIPFTVVGRGEDSALNFEKMVGYPVIRGGVEHLTPDFFSKFTMAIIVVTENMLGIVTRRIIEKGIKKILVEKPGGLTESDITSVNTMAKQENAEVFVAYNRRFYASVKRAKELIMEDGGAISFNFEFTEWSHTITPLKKAEGVKKEWLLANSTHVIDLAFYLGGVPKKISAYVGIGNGVAWHPYGSIFCGGGKTVDGRPFSYNANWEAPGRWGVEILTQQHRLYLSPLEQLHIQKIGSVAKELEPINDELDKMYKPGLYLMLESFISDSKDLPTIQEQCDNLKWFVEIRDGNE